MKTIIKDLKGIATWYTVKPPLMATIFHSRTGVPPFFFVSCFKQVFYIAKHVLFPKNGVTQVGPSPHTGHLLKDNCSYVQNLTAGFLFCNYLFSSNVWFSNNHFHLLITEKIIYSWTTKEKTSPRVIGSHPMQGRIYVFLVSFFPTAYCYDTAYYIIHYFLHTSDCNRYFGQHETLSSKTK